MTIREDTDRELALAHEIERHWRCHVFPMSHVSPVDWVLYRDDDLLASVEVKTRRFESRRYSTFLINVHKLDALRDWQTAYGIPSILLVRFTDALLWSPLDEFVECGKRRIVHTTNGGWNAARADRLVAFLDLAPFRRIPT